jgi:hypothetical protein
MRAVLALSVFCFMAANISAIPANAGASESCYDRSAVTLGRPWEFVNITPGIRKQRAESALCFIRGNYNFNRYQFKSSIRRGADPEMWLTDNTNLLMALAQSWDEKSEMLGWLLSQKANAALLNNSNIGPLHAAIAHARDGAVTTLLEADVLKNMEAYKNPVIDYWPPLVFAAAYSDRHGDDFDAQNRIVETLLDYEADPREKGAYGVTAAHFAALAGRYKILARLIEEGADPNAQITGVVPTDLPALTRMSERQKPEHSRNCLTPGATPLMCAMESENAQVVVLLFENKTTDASIKDGRGRDAEAYAVETKNPIIIQLAKTRSAYAHPEGAKTTTVDGFSLRDALKNNRAQVLWDLRAQMGALPNLGDCSGDPMGALAITWLSWMDVSFKQCSSADGWARESYAVHLRFQRANDADPAGSPRSPSELP